MSLYASHTDVRSELIQTFWRWWLANRGEDIPDRASLDPMDMKSLLPNLVISDVEPDPFRIRYRLVGTKVVDATGLDFTGQYLDELLPSDPDEPWVDEYRKAYETRAPVFGKCTVKTAFGAKYLYEFGIFPLRNNSQSIAQFVGIEDYFEFARLHASSEPWKRR